MILISLLSLFVIVSSQTHKRSACVKLESAFDSFCPSQAERSAFVPLQGRPGKVGPSGPVGEKGRQGIKGDKGNLGEANYDRVEEMISQKVQEVLDEQKGNILKMSNLLAEANERIKYLEKKAALYISECGDVNMDSAVSRNVTGGVFRMWIPNVGFREVYCDLMTDGGNWTVFQRRMDGSVNFNRNWHDYANGFGNARGEFWLGLEAIHQLTRAGNHELRVDVIEYDSGIQYYAKYSLFTIGPATDFYRLTLMRLSGNISDMFTTGDAISNNQQFTTFDQDHDSWSSNCASQYKGGWWFRACLRVHLNGLFENRNGWGGIHWHDQNVIGTCGSQK